MLDVKAVFTPLAQQTGSGLEGANDVLFLDLDDDFIGTLSSINSKIAYFSPKFGPIK